MPKKEKTDAEVAAPHFQHPQSQTNQPEYGQVYGTAPDLNSVNEQVQTLQGKVDTNAQKRINLNTDIIGVFETILAAPTTTTPTSPYQQIKIYNGKLYFYDSLNRTWDVAGGSSSYGGYVTSAGGMGSPFPAGWSVTNTGTGAYTITHNLGTTNYTVVLTAAGASFHACAIYTINANTFTCSLATIATAALQNGDFTFILLPA